MNRRLSDRLASLALALVITFGLAGGMHSLAAREATSAATSATSGQMAHSAGTPACGRV